MLVKYNVGKLKVIFKRNDTCTCILYAAFLYDTGLISLYRHFFLFEFCEAEQVIALILRKNYDWNL